ncbi:hypothetical protein FZEAL_2642 [Fusarium zealandicum]|uniref:Protein kinase domain-containing protein n=1 Tax=Fusarium zealandicum TaxID=1053134 RepID=A0A8H4UR30_9HYPO|nr:hypothetical protein FZEAL_2642 [Fusarium zealandicum]
MVNGNVNHDLAQFENSLSKSVDYPLNLVRTVEFSYILEAYKSRIVEDEEKYFDDSLPRIRIWDLLKPQDTSHVRRTAVDQEELRGAISETPKDPYRRFVFLQSASSRAPLDCTQNMLSYLFTHHQVMASFLDFSCTFKDREMPHTFTSFRHENYIGSEHYQSGLNGIGRSGIRLQHCFNILGIERDRKSKGWLQRQTAAYHSFDLVQGQVLWIVIKGDATMRKRLESATEEFAQKGQTSLHSVQGSFAQALKDHLILLQWCAENWDAYTESLEAKYRDFAGAADHGPVEDMAKDIEVNRKRDKIRKLSFASDANQQSSRSKYVPQPRAIIRRLSEKASGLGTMVQEQPPTPRVVHHRIEEMVRFDKLQALSCLDTTLGEAIATIDQNKRVLAEIKQHYHDIVNSAAFKIHIASKSALKVCKQATSEFIDTIGRLEGDLENYKGNLRTILRGVERTESMYNGILQYQSMRTAEYFAKSSEESAGIMQVWTEQMHEKTMSMHVITVFTLIFLPGTFVATIFSSGILTFGEEGSGGFGSSIGDWKVRVAGLKLSLIVPPSSTFESRQPPSFSLVRFPRSTPRVPRFLAQDWLAVHSPTRFSALDQGQATIRPHLTGTSTAGLIPLSLFSPPRNARVTRAASVWLMAGPLVYQVAEQLGDLQQLYCGRNGIEGQKPHYIPRFALEEFWKCHSIKAILNECSIGSGPDDIADITEHFLGIFSLLVYVERMPCFNFFLDQNIPDSHFPLPASYTFPDAPSYDKLSKAIRKKQWIFFPVTFQDFRYNRVFVPRQIFPIHNEELLHIGENVKVHKIEACTSPNPTFLVRKTYYEEEQKQYEREKKTFNNLQNHPSDNIIRFHGCYRQELIDGTTTYNLILDYVDGGNLEQFFETDPPTTPGSILQFWEAFVGALEGLHHLHISSGDLAEQGHQGIHQDIKPENLLVSKGPPGQAYKIKLIIADFGYSHTKIVRNVEDTSGIDSHGGQTYGAPECSHHAPYTQRGTHRITTKADIWALGCVMSEAAAWVVNGVDGRKDYSTMRANETRSIPSFYESGHDGCFHNGTQALVAVQKMHEKLRGAAASFDPITPQVIDIIHRFMLVPEQHRMEGKLLREKLYNITHADYPQMKGGGVPSERQVLRRPVPEIAPNRPPPSTPLPPCIEIPTSAVFGTIFRTPSPLPGIGGNPNGIARAISRRCSRPTPLLTFDQASEYRSAMRGNRTLDNSLRNTENVISQLKGQLENRDHIFLIDMSETMKEHSMVVQNRFETLGWIAKQFDTNGIELCFSSELPKVYKDRSTTKLSSKFRNQKWNQITFEHKLGIFVDSIVIPRLSSLRKYTGRRKELNIFILTDGRWGANLDEAAGMEKPIKRLIEKIKEKKLSRTQVALQFLRFGDDEEGKRYLSYLDNFGYPLGCDCVDTKPIDGNIFEMFLGAIDSSTDRADENPPPMSPSSNSMSKSIERNTVASMQC